MCICTCVYACVYTVYGWYGDVHAYLHTVERYAVYTRHVVVSGKRFYEKSKFLVFFFFFCIRKTHRRVVIFFVHAVRFLVFFSRYFYSFVVVFRRSAGRTKILRDTNREIKRQDGKDYERAT